MVTGLTVMWSLESESWPGLRLGRPDAKFDHSESTKAEINRKRWEGNIISVSDTKED